MPFDRAGEEKAVGARSISLRRDSVASLPTNSSGRRDRARMIRLRSSTDPTQFSGRAGPARTLSKLWLRRLADRTKRTSPSRITGTTTEMNGSAPAISRRSLTSVRPEASDPPDLLLCRRWRQLIGRHAVPHPLGEQRHQHRRVSRAPQAQRHPFRPAIEQSLRLDREVRDIVVVQMDRRRQRFETGDMVDQLAIHRIGQGPCRLGRACVRPVPAAAGRTGKPSHYKR